MYHNLFLFLGVKRTLHGSVKPRSNSFGSPNFSSSVSYCLFISGLHSSGLNPLKEGDSWYLGDTSQGGGDGRGEGDFLSWILDLDHVDLVKDVANGDKMGHPQYDTVSFWPREKGKDCDTSYFLKIKGLFMTLWASKSRLCLDPHQNLRGKKRNFRNFCSTIAVIPLTVNKIASSGVFVPLKPLFPL